MSNPSRIFVRNRALGYVSNHIPCFTRYLKTSKQHLIVTCVGKSMNTYGFDRLTLLTVSDCTEEEITCMTGDNNCVFTASGSKIHSWKRGTEIYQTLTGHSKPIHLLLVFGPHLISVDEDSILKVWDRRSEEIFLELTFDNSTFRITTIMHPNTYLNKILLGSEQGMMKLWNLKSSKLIHTFDGWDAAITVLEQAPAIDVVAVGLSDGRIILHNLKYDETVMKFIQDWGLVTAISFRTDGEPIMATGCGEGHIIFWNLEERKVDNQLLDAHHGAVASIKCLPNEPIMITSSPDNSVKVWIFDQMDHSARLLKFREGHAAQPTCIRFHGSTGVHILSTSQDSSLRVFCTISETSNCSMGRASYNRKKAKKKKKCIETLLMPPMIEFTAETTREKEWDNIAAIHLGIPIVTTWSFDKKKMGDLKLLPQRLANANRKTLSVVASCLFLTRCGNFVIVGYSTGHVDRFNIQSGVHRCTYGSPTAHKAEVRGVVVDPLNQRVITGCGAGLIKFWPFKPPPSTDLCPKPVSQISLDEGVSFFRMHKESSLLTIVLEDYSIFLLDIETNLVVRKLRGHTRQITDVTFSPDARWIISASMDCTIRTWDLPTSTLIDYFKVDSPCTSLTMSPTGHYLATIHVNNIGIYLWSNKTLFSHISFKPIDPSVKPRPAELPTYVGKEGVILLEDEEEEVTEMEEEPSPEQIGDLVTLSNFSTSRWLNLLDLDLIKKRNKPKEPPRVPTAAPFFLPTVPSLELKFDFSSVRSEDGLRMLNLERMQNYTAFGKLLDTTVNSENFQPVIEKLKSMGPSAIDLEVNSLAIEAQGSETLLLQFMKVINCMLSANRDYELAQSYLGLFIKTHGDLIARTPILHRYLETLQESQKKGWETLQTDLLYCLCVLDSQKK